ncbi:MAG TPA: DUF1835 domain-containing protein [Thermoanaerobaculia bacterium]|jgi:hypothetical protein|nr:DUF1835 domain-containing protein [Thermoanaerobaculia bacterium]
MEAFAPPSFLAAIGRRALPASATIPNLLHVLNGDCAADQLRDSGVPGRITVSADVLHEGPVPAGLSLERWRKTRARYLAESGYGDYDQCLTTLTQWDRALEGYRSYDEVVLWFEHDLFDQLLLIRLLDWFSTRDLGLTRLSLISIAEHPAVPRFIGMGQLTPEQMAGLMDRRQRVTGAQTVLARHAWRVFSAPEPVGIELLLKRDTSALPFLEGALRRHLEEFPAVRNGLSRTEEEILTVLAEGSTTFEDLFRTVQALEERPYLGDTTFLRIVRELAARPWPLVRLEPGANDSFRAQHVTLTSTGTAVLAGKEDRVRLHGIDRWLGGVHLSGGEAAWRWDAERGRMVSLAL